MVKYVKNGINVYKMSTKYPVDIFFGQLNIFQLHFISSHNDEGRELMTGE